MDFINDLSGRHILRLSNLLEVPDYAKQASVTEEDIKPLPNSAFASPHKREFPVDTAGHVWISYGYCKSAGVTDANLLASLRKAGELFEISKDLEAIDTAFDTMAKQANARPERRFAVSVDFGPGDPASDNAMRKAGGVHGFYPISTPFEIEESARKLANDRERVPAELFAEGCRNIVEAAKSASVDFRMLPPRVIDYGVPRLPDEGTLLHYAEMRKQATNDDFYTQVAETALHGNEDIPSHEFAELWLNADRMNGYKSAKHEPDPFLIFHSGPTVESVERELESWVDIGGAPVPLTKVASVRETNIRKCFAKETADRLVEIVKSAATAKGSEITAAFSDFGKDVQSVFVKRLLLAV